MWFGAFVISVTFIHQFQVVELKGNKLSMFINYVKVFSMVSLVVVPLREYFLWTLREKQSDFSALIWLLMIIISVAFLFIPVFGLTNQFFYDNYWTKNGFFIGINLFALVALSYSDWLIRRQLKRNKKIWEKSYRIKKVFIDCHPENEEAHSELSHEIEELDYLINIYYPATLILYDQIVWYADFCTVLSVSLTLLLYIVLPFWGCDTNMTYEKFFDGATTFQLIVSSITYFVISVLHQKKI